jgi:hypothetical protein
MSLKTFTDSTFTGGPFTEIVESDIFINCKIPLVLSRRGCQNVIQDELLRDYYLKCSLDFNSMLKLNGRVLIHSR